MSTNLPTTHDAPTDADELRVQVAELAAVNDDLLALIEAQRDTYRRVMEDVLLTFAAKGYRPAAQALLMIRRAFDAKPGGTH